MKKITLAVALSLTSLIGSNAPAYAVGITYNYYSNSCTIEGHTLRFKFDYDYKWTVVKNVQISNSVQTINLPQSGTKAAANLYNFSFDGLKFNLWFDMHTWPADIISGQQSRSGVDYFKLSHGAGSESFFVEVPSNVSNRSTYYDCKVPFNNTYLNEYMALPRKAY